MTLIHDTFKSVRLKLFDEESGLVVTHRQRNHQYADLAAEEAFLRCILAKRNTCLIQGFMEVV